MRVGYLLLAASVAMFASWTGVSASSAVTPNALTDQGLAIPADAIMSNDKRFLRIRDEDTEDSDEDETDEDSEDEERALPTLEKSLSEKISTSTSTAAKKFTKSKSASALLGMTSKQENAMLTKFDSYVWGKNKELFKHIDEKMKVTPDEMAVRLGIAAKRETMKPYQLQRDPDYLLWVYFSRYWKGAHAS